MHWLSQQLDYEEGFDDASGRIIPVLLNAGCDPNAEDLNGETPSQLAEKRGLTSMVDLLKPFVQACNLQKSTPNAVKHRRLARL